MKKKKRASAAVLAGILALSMCLAACRSKKIKPVAPEDFLKTVESHGFKVRKDLSSVAQLSYSADYTDTGISVMFTYFSVETEKEAGDMFDAYVQMSERIAEKVGVEGEITKKDSYCYAKYDVSGSGRSSGQPDILVIKAETMLLVCYTSLTDKSNEIRKAVLDDLGIKIEIKT